MPAALPVDWTDPIVEALPDWLRAELGLDDGAIAPPPNLPGYAPLPGFGGGYQPPAATAPATPTPATPAPAEGVPGWAYALGGAVAAGAIVALALYAAGDSER